MWRVQRTRYEAITEGCFGVRRNPPLQAIRKGGKWWVVQSISIINDIPQKMNEKKTKNCKKVCIRQFHSVLVLSHKQQVVGKTCNRFLSPYIKALDDMINLHKYSKERCFDEKIAI